MDDKLKQIDNLLNDILNEYTVNCSKEIQVFENSLDFINKLLIEEEELYIKIEYVKYALERIIVNKKLTLSKLLNSKL